jgi:CMP-N,N'-diacetyllegionaminic acid synthase
MTRVLGIVPARGGSKRVIDKNLRLLGGKSLVARAIEAACAARAIHRVCVSSDDPRVLSLARSNPNVVAIERPAELAQDASPAIDYVRHTLEVVESTGGDRFDVVVIVQPTSPLTLATDIDATVRLLLESGAESAVSVVQLDHAVHPVKLKRMIGDRLLPFYEDERGRMATHELPEVFVRNCAVYATRRTVVQSGSLLGEDCRGYVMPRTRSIDINDEFDFAVAEVLLARSGGS